MYGWQKKDTVANEIERAIFERYFWCLSGECDSRVLSSLSEDMLKYIKQYNP